MSVRQKEPNNPTDHYDYLVKVLFLGDSAVGKSSLLARFCGEKFSKNFILTIGADFRTKIITSEGKKVKLQVWDTAGQERFRNIPPMYYRAAMGVLLTYDITNRQSFRSVLSWMNSIEENSERKIPKILLGNKQDLEKLSREVSYDEARKFADQYDMPFFETSALTMHNVNEAFDCLSSIIIKKLERESQENLTSIRGKRKKRYGAKAIIIKEDFDQVKQRRSGCC